MEREREEKKIARKVFFCLFGICVAFKWIMSEL